MKLYLTYLIVFVSMSIGYAQDFYADERVNEFCEKHYNFMPPHPPVMQKLYDRTFKHGEIHTLPSSLTKALETCSKKEAVFQEFHNKFMTIYEEKLKVSLWPEHAKHTGDIQKMSMGWFYSFLTELPTHTLNTFLCAKYNIKMQAYNTPEPNMYATIKTGLRSFLQNTDLKTRKDICAYVMYAAQYYTKKYINIYKNFLEQQQIFHTQCVEDDAPPTLSSALFNMIQDVMFDILIAPRL